MNAGDTITAILQDGSRLQLMLDEVVVPDRTYGQADAGFHARSVPPTST